MRLTQENVKNLVSCRALFSLGLSVSLAGLAAAPAWAADWEVRRAGIEVEFANPDNISAKLENVSDEMFERILTVVKRRYHDGGAKIEIRKVMKGDREIRFAVYTDQDGREWMVVPESVNTTGLDGLEFVSPPLDTLSDEANLKKILNRIKKDKLGRQGIRSSVHVTLDVSDKIVADPNGKDGNENISKVVDTILFIEGHWPEIYAAISPKRYGTIVNRFGVPLAFDQADLLRELAAMAPETRTRANVEAVFRKYHQREVMLKGGDEKKAWKYRAANYGKFFGLAPGGKRIPVIEFRIPDFDEAEKILADRAFFRALIDNADKEGPIREFRSPFAGIAAGKNSESELNVRVASLSKQNYEAFFEKIDLEAEDYPMWNDRAKDVEALRDSADESWKERLIGSYDFRKPFEIGGGAATFGLEAEFRGGNADKILDIKGNTYKLRKEKYPFLDERVSKEGTGNYEVRSIPTDRLADLERQLKTVKSTLKHDLRGFHMHMRVPISVYNEIGRDRVNGFLSRAADVVSTWRLQYRMHFFALKTWSTSRLEPDSISNRGALRVSDLGGHLDIEIRGFMGSADEIVELARVILVALKNPEFLKGFEKFQRLTFNEPTSLKDMIEDYAKTYENKKLTDAEINLLENLETSAIYQKKMLWPLLALDDAPYFNEFQKKKIRDAKFEFAKSVRIVMRNQLELKKYSDEKMLYKQFRHRIKRFAQTLDLNDMLLATLLMPKETPEEYRISAEKLDKLLRTGQSVKIILDELKKMDTEQLVKLLRDPAYQASSEQIMSQFSNRISAMPAQDLQLAFFSEKSKKSRLAEQFLASGKHPATEEILLKALKSNRKEINERAAKVLTKSATPNVRLLELASKSENPEVRQSATNALKTIAGWEAGRPLLEKSMNDKSPEVRQEAAKIAPLFTQTDRFADLRRLLQDPDPGVRQSAGEALRKMPVADIAPFVLEVIQTGLGDSSSLQAILTAWKERAPKIADKSKRNSQILEIYLAMERKNPMYAGYILSTLNLLPKEQAIAYARTLVMNHPETHHYFAEAYGASPKESPFTSTEVFDILEHIMTTNPGQASAIALGIVDQAKGNEAAAEFFMRIFPRLPDNSRKMISGSSFAGLGSARVLKLFKDEPKGEIRERIVRASGVYSNGEDLSEEHKLFARVQALAFADPSLSVLQTAISYLAYLYSGDLMVVLGETIFNNGNATAMKYYVGNLTDQHLQFLLKDTILLETLLEKMLAAGKGEMVLPWARVIARLPSDVSRRLLEKYLRPDQPRLVRMALAASLVSRNSADNSTFVKIALNDPDVNIRGTALSVPGAETLAKGTRAFVDLKFRKKRMCRALFNRVLPQVATPTAATPAAPAPAATN